MAPTGRANRSYSTLPGQCRMTLGEWSKPTVPCSLSGEQEGLWVWELQVTLLRKWWKEVNSLINTYIWLFWAFLVPKDYLFCAFSCLKFRILLLILLLSSRQHNYRFIFLLFLSDFCWVKCRHNGVIAHSFYSRAFCSILWAWLYVHLFFSSHNNSPPDIVECIQMREATVVFYHVPAYRRCTVACCDWNKRQYWYPGMCSNAQTSCTSDTVDLTLGWRATICYMRNRIETWPFVRFPTVPESKRQLRALWQL